MNTFKNVAKEKKSYSTMCSCIFGKARTLHCGLQILTGKFFTIPISKLIFSVTSELFLAFTMN